MRRRVGVTLVELLVVLAILGLTTALSGLALRRIDAPRAPDVSDAVRALRRDAVTRARAVTGTVRRNDSTYVVTALPDGRLLADTALHLDLATGLADAVAP
jgi:prepilin-type N-terminal cleavage/methylation domain-containing protein